MRRFSILLVQLLGTMPSMSPSVPVAGVVVANVGYRP